MTCPKSCNSRVTQRLLLSGDCCGEAFGLRSLSKALMRNVTAMFLMASQEVQMALNCPLEEADLSCSSKPFSKRSQSSPLTNERLVSTDKMLAKFNHQTKYECPYTPFISFILVRIWIVKSSEQIQSPSCPVKMYGCLYMGNILISKT